MVHLFLQELILIHSTCHVVISMTWLIKFISELIIRIHLVWISKLIIITHSSVILVWIEALIHIGHEPLLRKLVFIGVVTLTLILTILTV